MADDLKPTDRPLPRFMLDGSGQLRVDAAQTGSNHLRRSLLPVLQKLLSALRAGIHAVLAWRPNSKQKGTFRFNLPKVPLRSVSLHLSRRTVATFSVCLALAFAGLVWHAHASDGSMNASGNVQGASTATGPTPGSPSFSTVLPASQTIKSLGGWYRVSPPERDPVYAFVDHVGDVEVTVSEQPLPKSFQSDVNGQVAQLALSFGAEEKLTSSNLTIYIGTSAKGPQSVILTEHNLLLLLKSTDKLTSDQWIAFISSLH